MTTACGHIYELPILAGGVRTQHLIGIDPWMPAAQAACRLVRDTDVRIISFHNCYTPVFVALLYSERSVRARAKCDIYIFQPVVYNVCISVLKKVTP